MRLTATERLACAALLALGFAASARAHGAAAAASAAASQCNDAMSEPVAYVALPGRPFSTVTSRDGCWLFVSLTGPSNGVAVLARSRGQITLKKVVPVDAAPTGMTLTHDGKLLVVAGGDRVVFLDARALAEGRGEPVLGHIKDGPNPGSIYVNTTADDRLLFVSDEAAQTITVIDLRRARREGFKETAIVGKIPVGRAPIALTFSPDGRWLYTTSQRAPESLGWPVECKPEGVDPSTARPQFPQGAVIVVDVAKAATDPAKAAAAHVKAGCNPVRLAISPDGSRAYVTARNSNALLAFDTRKFHSDAARARVGEVPVGTSPVGVAVVNGGRHVIVTNSNRFAREQTARQTMTVIDAARVGEGAAAVIGTIQAGVFPREFGHSPDGRTLFVANYVSSELEVIDLKRMPVDRAPAAAPR